jgi:predicted subunit of tRNA(5-methylaminomethyl-2-thiouridylate) methyltransferase
LIFLRSFIKSGSRFDPKKSWIKFSNKINGLGSSSFDNLIPQYLNIKSRKSDETYYAISDNFWPSVRKFVDNNQIDVKMKDFFAFIK